MTAGSSHCCNTDCMSTYIPFIQVRVTHRVQEFLKNQTCYSWAEGSNGTWALACSFWSDLVQIDLVGEQCQAIVAERSRHGQDPGLIQPRPLFRISDLWAQGPEHHLVGTSKSVKPLKQLQGPSKVWRKLRLSLEDRTLSPRWLKKKSTGFPRYIPEWQPWETNWPDLRSLVLWYWVQVTLTISSLVQWSVGAISLTHGTVLIEGQHCLTLRFLRGLVGRGQGAELRCLTSIHILPCSWILFCAGA